MGEFGFGGGRGGGGGGNIPKQPSEEGTFKFTNDGEV